MSRLIKSSNIVLGEQRITISSDITRPPQEGVVNVEGLGVIEGVADETATTRNIVIDAENAALSILDDAEKKAQSILEEARQEAKRIEAEALENASATYDKHREDGQKDGYAQGFDAGQSEAQVLIDEALMIKEEWEIKKKQFIQNVENELIDLSIKIVENVINREIKEPAYILDLIKKGIDHLTYSSSIVVRVSEYDFDYASANKSKIHAMLEGVEHIEVRKDLSLNYGECMIDTESGSTDVGIDAQLEQVKSIFNALLASE